MDFLNKIKKLYSLSDEDNGYGYSEDTISELEKSLKINLPKTLKDYYLKLGKNWQINEVDMFLSRLDGTYNAREMLTYPSIETKARRWKQLAPGSTGNSTVDKIIRRFTNNHINNAWDSGYYVFCKDFEGAFSWGIKLDDLKKDNPIVSAICNYPGYADSRWNNWNKIFELDKFLLEMACWNGSYGGLRYYAISDRQETPMDNKTIKIIEDNWMEIDEISKNPLRESIRYFTNDFSDMLSFGSDQLYAGTSDPKIMSDILNMFDLKWRWHRLPPQELNEETNNTINNSTIDINKI